MWCSIKRVTKLAVAKVSYPLRIPAYISYIPLDAAVADLGGGATGSAPLSTLWIF